MAMISLVRNSAVKELELGARGRELDDACDCVELFWGEEARITRLI